jgi:hemolysin activation/secretion protein
MRRNSLNTVFGITALFLLFDIPPVYPRALSSSQTAGGLQKQENEIQKERELENRIIKEKTVEKEAVSKKEEKGRREEKKFFVKKIEIQGCHLIPEKIVRRIAAARENKYLSLADIEKVCDLLTAQYRKRGYLTSRAYFPPQNITGGLVAIIVMEGKTGDTQIKGNRYFSTGQIEKKLRAKKFKVFNYYDLLKSLRYWNEQPDVAAKAALVPGREPGETDIIVDVRDRLPWHIGFDYDNYGSRFIEKNRYAATVKHNNFLGREDKLYLKFQGSKGAFYELESCGYKLPLGGTREISASYLWNKIKLGREYKSLRIEGKSEIGNLSLAQTLIEGERIIFKVNPGFDYKNIYNYTAQVLTSRDKVRMAKLGLDWDSQDNFGRTIVVCEEDFGIPHILGGAPGRDPMATREGGGAKFIKTCAGIYRLQPLPFSGFLFVKSQLQLSSYRLLSCEQFQIGGISNVRSYPAAEYSADEGFSAGVEWNFPLYFLPEKIKIPFSSDQLYQALRGIIFYDWGTIWYNDTAGEDKNKQTIKGWGYGFIFNPGRVLSLRAEVAYPCGRTPSDGNRMHAYLSASAEF